MTLSAKSLLPRLRSGAAPIEIEDIPRIAAEELGLRGLCVQTELLAGVSIERMDALRDRADKAACPCLLLVESQPHPIGDADERVAEPSLERLGRVVRVAHRLGCSSVAIAIKDSRATPDEAAVVDALKRVVNAAERLELNVLIAPQPGMTETPDQLTALIRKVGGFRIGSFPDFEVAAQSGDASGYLRAITPYASAVSVLTPSLDGRTKDPTYDLSACLEAIQAVGYDGTLALECRGGDPTEPIRQTKDAIEAFLTPESA